MCSFSMPGLFISTGLLPNYLPNSRRIDLCADRRVPEGRRELDMDAFSNPAHYGDEGTPAAWQEH